MKKFLTKLTYTLLPFWLAAFIGVAVFTLALCPAMTGDIGRLALIPFGQKYDEDLEKGNKMPEMVYTTITQTLDLKHISADVLTVGDSFSERYEHGYQNYLAAHGVKVVNCDRSLYYNPVTYAYEIMDQGLIDSTNTDILVVQVVEWSFDNFMENFNPKAQLTTMLNESKKFNQKKPNDWSLTRLRDYILLKTGFAHVPVAKVELDRPYFTSDNPSALFFMKYDLPKKESFNKDKAKHTFQMLLDKANEKHISLVFVVAVDKYNLYQDHIVNNPYGRLTVTEDIQQLFGVDPHFLLTKYCLQPLVERGEKDIFLYNDTHWSYKGAEVVGNELYKKIAPQLHVDK